jgi:hypothetical protein
MEKNPLLNIVRQPKIYIKLPSQGKFWPEGSLSHSINGEYPVYSMTAKDELLLKTPDALLNGQAVVDVIQHCMPNILNAWYIPSLDLEAILIAIRLATFGESFDLDIDLGVEEKFTYTLDLRVLLDTINQTINWDPVVEIDNQMVCYVRPLYYKEMTESSLEIFETQRIITMLSNDSLSQEQKIETFRESFKKLSDINIQLINSVVYKIESTVGTVENVDFIREFLEECDSSIFNKIKNHLDVMKKNNTMKPLTIATTDEQRAKGLADTVEVPLTFDQSSFFG